jgi:putative colanic acid biosynthesis UDP-glucose lipid carrier transferase
VALLRQAAGLGDLLALALAGLVWVRAGPTPLAFSPLEAALIAFLLLVMTFLLMRAFGPVHLGQMLRLPWTVLEAMAYPALVGFAAVLLSLVTLGGQATHALVLWAALAAMLLMASRLLVSAAAQVGVRQGWLRRRIAIIGATEEAEGLIADLTAPENSEPPDMVGIFDDRDATRRPAALHGVPVRGDVRALAALAALERIDVIVIALPMRRAIDILRVIQQVQWLSSDVMVMLGGDNAAPQGAPRPLIAGRPALRLVRAPVPGAAVLVKGALDKLLASALCLLVLPILLVAALAIRLESPGPVLFRQRRVGQFGRPFEVLKLRTLRVDPADDGRRGVREGDRRITRVGAFLRATCIDEMPQIINVLRGEMSFVGPRPHVPGIEVMGLPMEEIVPGYGARHRVKPGITGWAQVNGLSGTIATPAMAREVVGHDLAYLSEWSLWLDLRIMLRTAIVFMLGRDAFEARRHDWRDV